MSAEEKDAHELIKESRKALQASAPSESKGKEPTDKQLKDAQDLINESRKSLDQHLVPESLRAPAPELPQGQVIEGEEAV